MCKLQGRYCQALPSTVQTKHNCSNCQVRDSCCQVVNCWCCQSTNSIQMRRLQTMRLPLGIPESIKSYSQHRLGSRTQYTFIYFKGLLQENVVAFTLLCLFVNFLYALMIQQRFCNKFFKNIFSFMYMTRRNNFFSLSIILTYTQKQHYILRPIVGQVHGQFDEKVPVKNL